jgi:hypothetical protein
MGSGGVDGRPSATVCLNDSGRDLSDERCAIGLGDVRLETIYNMHDHKPKSNLSCPLQSPHC